MTEIYFKNLNLINLEFQKTVVIPLINKYDTNLRVKKGKYLI